MKIYRTLILGREEPENKHDLWLDTSKAPNLVFRYFDGEWKPVEDNRALNLIIEKINEINVTLLSKVDTEDPRLSDDRNAKDVYPWAKEENKPTYTLEELGAEPAFEKNTAFNKNFGTADNEVVQGDRVLTAVPEDAIFTDTVYDDTSLREKVNTKAGIPTYNAETHILKFEDGNKASIDINLLQGVTGLVYDSTNKEIVATDTSGNEVRIPVADFIEVYKGSIGNNIQISIGEHNTITATLLDNSIDTSKFKSPLKESLSALEDTKTVYKDNLFVEAINSIPQNLRTKGYIVRFNTPISDNVFRIASATFIGPDWDNYTHWEGTTGVYLTEDEYIALKIKLPYVIYNIYEDE